MANNKDSREYKDLEERTLVVRNFDSEQVTREMLEELFQTFGPVRNVVLKPEFAFIEYSCKETVGYAMAMLADVRLHDRKLRLHPKIEHPSYYQYLDNLKRFENQCRSNPKCMDKFLSDENRQEIKKTTKNYRNSRTIRREIQNRLRDYSRHYDLESFNPYFGEEILRVRDTPQHHHRNDNHRDRSPYWHEQSNRHHDRYDGYHRGHRQPPPPPPPYHHGYSGTNYYHPYPQPPPPEPMYRHHQHQQHSLPPPPRHRHHHHRQ